MKTTQEPQLIRFDWAMKYILRDKANFDILEGFLSALLNEEIQVLSLLDSESNQETEDLKYNRVDLLIQDSSGRHLIIEVQNEHESDYLHRLLFGTCKVIIDTMQLGQPYREIAKVISISILYFNLGTGDDYVYYGSTAFRGLHTHHPLTLRKREQLTDRYVLRQVDIEKDIFPEYYLIHVERFEDEIHSPLDEWIYMLKHERVRDNFTSRNIDKAREKLSLLKMSAEKRRQYDKYLMQVASERDIMETAHSKGEKIGFEKGERSKALDTARNMLREDLTPDLIAKVTGLSLEEVTRLVEE